MLPQKLSANFSACFVHFNVFSSFQHSSGLTHKKISVIFSAFFVHFKRLSPTANKCWPTRVGQQLVCVKDATTSQEKLGESRDEFYLSPTDCQHVVVSFTHTNLSLSTRVGQHLFVV